MRSSGRFSAVAGWARRHPWRAGLAALLGVVLLLDQLLPPPLPRDGPGMVVVARDGSPLRGWPDADGMWRIPVAPEQVSPRYLEALLTYEDRWFYWHPGVNPVAMLRAGWQLLTEGRIVSGGSTLSMQVARALEPVPRSVGGKLRQILRALQIELRLSKREILTLYLNHAPMGGIVEGVEMASRSYLGKSAAQLSPAEATLLVVLPQAPSRLRPDRHPELAQRARDKVLRRMAELRRWPQTEVDDALIERVGANPPRMAWLAPLAAERLRQAARHAARAGGGNASGTGTGTGTGTSVSPPSESGPASANDAGTSTSTGTGVFSASAPASANGTGTSGSPPTTSAPASANGTGTGVSPPSAPAPASASVGAATAIGSGGAAIVRSTLDRDMQTMLERTLADRVGQLPRFVSMAALVMDSASLEILAYAGSADFNDARRFSHVDMVRGIRSPGSTLKPFLYAMALDEGLIHSESLLADTPQSFGGYDPGNFQANFSGPVSVSDALQRSLNVPAVDLLDRVGPARFAARLSSAGLRLRLPKNASPNLSIILGGAGTSLEELVGAYRSLAADGMAGTPRITPDAPRHTARMMSPGAAFIIRSILEGGGHPDQPFVEAEPGGARLAWKTGTSYGFRDAWAVGVSGRYTLGVWIGRPDGTPNPGFFGANVAAPLLHQIAQSLPRGGEPARPRPAEVSVVKVCWPLGTAAAVTPPELCHQQHTAWALRDTVPPTLPDRLRARGLLETVWIDPDTGLRTTPSCQPQAVSRQVARWPSLLEAWMSVADRKRLGLGAWSPECPQGGVVGGIRLMGLRNGSRLRAAPGQQAVNVTLEAVGGDGRNYWLLDGKQVASAANGGKRQVLALSGAGAHTVAVMDAAGHYDSLQINLD